MNSSSRSIAGWLIITLMVCQFVPLNRTGKRSSAGLKTLPPEVSLILEKRCGECHSDRTHWPKTAYIAPLSWYVVYEVQLSRTALNISEFQGSTKTAEIRAKNRILTMITSGNAENHAHIPGFDETGLTEQERDVLLGWASGSDKEQKPGIKNSGRNHQDRIP